MFLQQLPSHVVCFFPSFFPRWWSPMLSWGFISFSCCMLKLVPISFDLFLCKWANEMIKFCCYHNLLLYIVYKVSVPIPLAPLSLYGLVCSVHQWFISFTGVCCLVFAQFPWLFFPHRQLSGFSMLIHHCLTENAVNWPCLSCVPNTAHSMCTTTLLVQYIRYIQMCIYLPYFVFYIFTNYLIYTYCTLCPSISNQYRTVKQCHHLIVLNNLKANIKLNIQEVVIRM